MKNKNIAHKFDNWLNVRSFLSKTGLVLLGLGLLLTAISFSKGIQVLMFIPAFVLGMFLYSLWDVLNAKKFVEASWKKIDKKTHLYVRWKKKFEYCYFRLAFDDGQTIKYLDINSNLYFSRPEKEGKYLLILQGRLDIFRWTIKLPPIPALKKGKKGCNKNIENDDFYFNIREYIEGDEVKRIDSIESLKRGAIYIREVIQEFNQKSSKRNYGENAVFVSSNLYIKKRDDLATGNKVEWMMILLVLLAIHLQWGNCLFLAVASFFLGLLFFVQKILKKEPWQSRFALNIFSLVLFISCFIEGARTFDLVQSGVHFLMLLSICKHFFMRERRDAFTYAFLMLFIFVGFSLFTLKAWFIVFFMVFLLLAIAIFSIYAAGEKREDFESSFGRPKTKKSYSFMNIAVVSLTVVLFFALPHGKNIQDTSFIQQPKDTQTGFSDEVSLNEVQGIKENFSKVIAIENADKNKVDEYKDLYWRGARFLHFSGDKWQKDRVATKPYNLYHASAGATESWNVKYYLNGYKNIFLPKIPLQIQGGYFYQKGDDNSLAEFKRISFNAKDLFLVFAKDKNGKIQDNYTSEFKSKIYIEPETRSLFDNFWKNIPSNVTNDPEKITKYIREDAGFSYSLGNPARNLESFLYEEKTGHCEYFATVLALTLQHFGFKATLVNGFYGGEWNEPASAWIVRSRDAHSWVEIFDDGKWQILDATPLISVSPFWFQRIMFVEDLIRYYDYFEMQWSNYIVDFTGNKQIALWGWIAQKVFFVIIGGFIILCFFVIKWFYPVLKINFNKNDKEKFMDWLSKKANVQVFALNTLQKKDTNLANKTRKIIFGANSNDEDLKKLKGEWSKIL